MKHRRHRLSLYAILLLGLQLLYWQKPGSKQLAALPPAQGADESQEAVSPPEDTRLVKLVNDLASEKPEELAQAFDELRRFPPAQVSTYLLQRLRELDAHHGPERDRLILLADALQLETDLAFWEALVARQEPGDGTEDRQSERLGLESRFAEIEEMQAIHNIGRLARTSRDARRVLVEIVLAPDPAAERTSQRQEAYLALKASDVATSLRVLKELPAGDELLKRL